MLAIVARGYVPSTASSEGHHEPQQATSHLRVVLGVHAPVRVCPCAGVHVCACIGVCMSLYAGMGHVCVFGCACRCGMYRGVHVCVGCGCMCRGFICACMCGVCMCLCVCTGVCSVECGVQGLPETEARRRRHGWARCGPCGCFLPEPWADKALPGLHSGLCWSSPTPALLPLRPALAPHPLFSAETVVTKVLKIRRDGAGRLWWGLDVHL